jgi:hypothetical protein
MKPIQRTCVTYLRKAAIVGISVGFLLPLLEVVLPKLASLISVK